MKPAAPTPITTSKPKPVTTTMTKSMQTRYSKVMGRAGNDMTEKQAERYFRQVVSLLDEVNCEPDSHNMRLQLARLANSLQSDYPDFC
jgi:hypothetical protein